MKTGRTAAAAAKIGWKVAVVERRRRNPGKPRQRGSSSGGGPAADRRGGGTPLSHGGMEQAESLRGAGCAASPGGHSRRGPPRAP